jgi:hypothetical protein
MKLRGKEELRRLDDDQPQPHDEAAQYRWERYVTRLKIITNKNLDHWRYAAEVEWCGHHKHFTVTVNLEVQLDIIEEIIDPPDVRISRVDVVKFPCKSEDIVKTAIKLTEKLEEDRKIIQKAYVYENYGRPTKE